VRLPKDSSEDIETVVVLRGDVGDIVRMGGEVEV
jgi:hypothetical protein